MAAPSFIRARALAKLQRGENMTKIADDLGLNRNTVAAWVKTATEKDGFVPPEHTRRTRRKVVFAGENS